MKINTLLLIAIIIFEIYALIRFIVSLKRYNQNKKSDQQQVVTYDITIYKMPGTNLTKQQEEKICQHIVKLSEKAMSKTSNCKNN